MPRARVRRPGIVASFAAAWAVQEAFRTYVWIFGGFPWNLLANPLADVPVLLGTAAIGGVFLTSFLVAALNAALFVAWTRPSRNARLAWLLAAAVGALAAAAIHPARPRPSNEVLQVGVVQPNVEQDLRWDRGTAERIQRDLEEQTRELCRVDRPVLVLWPESASPYAWSFNGPYRERVLRLCRELDVAILMSTAWSDAPADEDAPYYNAALLVTKDGPVLPPYFKQRLVPFGEYVPLAASPAPHQADQRAPCRAASRRGRAPCCFGSATGGSAARCATRSCTRGSPAPRRARAPTSSSRSRTTPGTAARARSGSTGSPRSCAPSRRGGRSSARPSRESAAP